MSASWFTRLRHWFRPRFLYPEPKLKRLAALKGEARFLAGRHSRTTETLRTIRIMVEFIRGFRAFQHLGPAVTIFGSARFPEGHPYYELARRIGATVAREGYVVVTGGGPGVMEAANRGAKEAGGYCIGANIVLPHEQEPNPFLDKVVTFYYFFVRKVMLIKYSYAYICLPGGLGTLDELSEALILIQTGKIYDFPIILVGKEHWKGLYDWMQNTLVKSHTVDASDMEFIHLTDDPNEVLEILKNNAKGIGLTLHPLSPHVD